MKIVVFTLGCKVNQIEGQSIIRELKGLGFDAHDCLCVADAYVVNTCAVTAEAARKSRQILSKIYKLNPRAPVFVCGCASQENKEAFLGKQAVRFVGGAAHKSSLAQAIADDLECRKNIDLGNFDLPLEFECGISPEKTKTRAFIKVQDGCDNFCNYCIVPHLRGRSRSKPIDDIVLEANMLARESKEIVVSGINLSDYGTKQGSSLIALIKALAPVAARKRLGSLENGVVCEQFLQAVSDADFCPHFHLSLQSGCDKVLSEMNRKYTVEQFAQSLRLIRQYFPLAAITTDIICGYPSETEQDFLISTKNIEQMEFADAHIFPYSKREGTPAAQLVDLPKAQKQQRTAVMAQLIEKSRRNFLQKNIGQKASVLFEEYVDGFFTGYTKNYIRVFEKSDTNLCEKEVEIVLDQKNMRLESQ